MLALHRPVRPSLDLLPAEIHEVVLGITMLKEEEGASPQAFLSLVSRRFHVQSTLKTSPESRFGPCRYTQVY